MGVFGIAQSALGFGLKTGAQLAVGTAEGTLRAATVVGKPLAKGTGKVLGGVGSASIDFFSGAGNQAVAAFSTRESAAAVAKSWGSIAGGIGKAFIKTGPEGKLGLTGFGAAALGGAMTFDKSRDLYTKEKARRMGEVDNKPVTLTPQMSIPQYEFNPRKRMGALDGGASGSLVFALHNMR